MKKLLATTLLLAVPFAASATGNFTGWHVGGELNTVTPCMEKCKDTAHRVLGLPF